MPPSLGSDAVEASGCSCLYLPAQKSPSISPLYFSRAKPIHQAENLRGPNEHRSLPEFLQLLLTQDSALQQEVNVGITWPALQTMQQAMFGVNYMRTLLTTSKVPAYSVYIADSSLVLCTEGRVLRHKCQMLPALSVLRFTPCSQEALTALPPASVAARSG